MSLILMEGNGLVHGMNPQNAEYTICGDAFDIGSEDGLENLRYTEKLAVSCPSCIAIIKGCRGTMLAR